MTPHLRLTQPKRFVPINRYSTQSRQGGTSFIHKPLGGILLCSYHIKIGEEKDAQYI